MAPRARFLAGGGAMPPPGMAPGAGDPESEGEDEESGCVATDEEEAVAACWS